MSIDYSLLIQLSLTDEALMTPRVGMTDTVGRRSQFLRLVSDADLP